MVAPLADCAVNSDGDVRGRDAAWQQVSSRQQKVELRAVASLLASILPFRSPPPLPPFSSGQLKKGKEMRQCG